jgi:hypothetical protein
MDRTRANEIIKSHPDAISFVKASHLEELSPLVEVHIEVVTVTKDEFHHLGGGTFYPKKETTDRFGSAAGISFAAVETSTRKDDGAYIGRAIPQEVGPDGKMITWAPAEYEFDPEIRAEEDILKKPDNFKTDQQKRLQVLAYKKVARRRADTGARAAAIISAIGMPTGFKNLFNAREGPKATRTFLFSRIIINTKNELVMNRALDQMLGNVQQLYGPTTGHTLLAEPTAEPRNVSPQEPDADVGDGFDLETETIPMDERSNLCVKLEEYVNSGILSPKAEDTVNALINDSTTPMETLRLYLDKCKAYQANQGGQA